MQVEILTPEKKVYSDQAYGVVLPGVSGSFEILDKHAPMVSALKSGKMTILKSKNETITYSIESGFVEVLNNKTNILVEGASLIN